MENKGIQNIVQMDQDKTSEEGRKQESMTAPPSPHEGRNDMLTHEISLKDLKPPVNVQTLYESPGDQAIYASSFFGMANNRQASEPKIAPLINNPSAFSGIMLKDAFLDPNAIKSDETPDPGDNLYRRPLTQTFGRSPNPLPPRSISPILCGSPDMQIDNGDSRGISTPQNQLGVQNPVRPTWPTQFSSGFKQQQGTKISQFYTSAERQQFAAVQYWRSDFDSDYLYQLDKRTRDLNPNVPKITALRAWYDADIKEHRRTQYIKEALCQNDKILTIAELDELELLADKEDRLPCAYFRKSIRRYSIHISRAAQFIIKRKSFEAATILVILANCLTLTMSKADQDPTESETLVENIFQALYTVEMVLKILGMGFIFNKGAYLRDYFNILDFFIVVSAYLAMMQGQSEGGLSLSSLRAFRVLKPLRAVNNIPGLRLIVQSILKALPLLKDTIIVLLFFFLIFAIGGVNLFQGMLRSRCVEIETGRVQIDDDTGNETICGDNQACTEGYFCGKRITNPNHDVTNFDNIFWALLNIFQCVTLEGWSEMMVLYQKVYTYYVLLFFVPLVFIGAFFLLNLTLAVINTSFNDAQELTKQKKAAKESELDKIYQAKKHDAEDDFEAESTPELQLGIDNERQDLRHVGIHEFFMAQRAGRKMREFAIKWHSEKEAKEKEKLKKENEQQAILDEQDKEKHVHKNSPRRSPRPFLSKPTVIRQAEYDIDTIEPPEPKRVSSQKVAQESLISRSENISPHSFSKVHTMHQIPTLNLKSHSRSKSSIEKQSSKFNLQAVQQWSEDADIDIKRIKEKVDKKFDTLNQTITEEEKVSDDTETNKSVRDFLDALDDIPPDRGVSFLLDKTDEPALEEQKSKRVENDDKSLDQSVFKIPNPSKSSMMLVNAFNDLRRANARDSYVGKSRLSSHANMLDSPRRRPNTQQDSGMKREQMISEKKKEDHLQKFQRRVQEELDFEQVMSRVKEDPYKETKVTLQPSSTQTKIQMIEDQHQYDLSFVARNSQDPVCFNLDQEANISYNLDDQSIQQQDKQLDLEDSVILSDSSLASHVDRYKIDAKVKQRQSALKMKKDLQAGLVTKNISPTLKRMLTSDFSPNKKVSKMDVTDEDDTTQFGGQSVKQQIDIYSNLNDNLTIDRGALNVDAGIGSLHMRSLSLISGGSPKSKIIKKEERPEKRTDTISMGYARAKNQKSQIYTKFDQNIFSEKKNDPYKMFDTKTQKVGINQGVPYRSTSQGDVFELRTKNNAQKRMRAFNPFIKTQEAIRNQEKEYLQREDQVIYSDDSEEHYMTSHFVPYQLKDKVRVQKVDEIVFDDDDEDALTLQQQPFETVMSIGHSSLLNHLNTKYIARRSDIIVSSTLSITLTPEENFEPTKFVDLDEGKTNDWIEIRSEFRSEGISTCKLMSIEEQHQIAEIETEEEDPQLDDITKEEFQSFASHSMVTMSEGNEEAKKQKILRKSRYFEKATKRLPRNLLSLALSPEQVMQLSEKDKRDYNIQKSKHELENRRFNHDATIAQTKFDLKMAKNLIEGLYWVDEEQQDEKQRVDVAGGAAKSTQDKDSIKENEPILIGRDGLKESFRLDQFEQAVKSIIKEKGSEVNELERLNSKDWIPAEIKTEFNLPDEMNGNHLNFEEVRNHDAQHAIKYSTWSGQEVLTTSINSEQSEWVASKIRSVRVWPKGKMNMIKKARSFLKIICMAPIFEHLMTLCVLLNTVVMSMDRYDIDEESEQFLGKANAWFTYIFIYEMGHKLLAIGPKKYAASKWNLLDGGIVILSIIEVVIEAQSDGSGGSSISAFRTVKIFRAFRVMRVARILRALHSMQIIIGVITRSFRSYCYVILLLFVFVFIYALLGIQIYQGKYDFGPDERITRGNFEDFSVAFVTTFQVLTMENWQQIMFISMRSARGSNVIKTLSAIYYVSWIFIGNFILLNLFLAILIDSFTSEESESQVSMEEMKEAEKKLQELKEIRLEEEKKKRRKKLGTSAKKNQSAHKPILKSQTTNVKEKVVTFTGKTKDELEMVEDLDELESEDIRGMLVSHKVIASKKELRQDIKIPIEIECNNSIYLFNREGCFRKNCYWIQQHTNFDRFIMALIALSSLQLALETYIQDLDKSDPIMITNLVIGEMFTYAFVFECVVKIVALGFVMDKNSYVRESWNQLDFFIVITSIIDNLFASSNIEALRILRMLRMLRPLRVVSHNLQLKMIVIALLDAGGSIVNVIIVVLVVWLMFAIFAVSTYKGTFFYCSIDKYKYQDQYDCIANGGEWLRYSSNFDNVGQAMMTLFIVSSLEGWPDIMHQAIDITRVDYGPSYQGDIKQSIFFIVFILIGSFFFLNFFIGVLQLKYTEAEKREMMGFTEEQLTWKEFQAMILKAKCPHSALHKPMSFQPKRLKAWRLVTSSQFEVTILTLIVLNMVQMTIAHEGQGPIFDQILYTSNFFFTGCFTIEAILKLFAFGRAYFLTTWNKFDFFIVIASILDIGLAIYQDKFVEDDGEQKQSALSVAPQLARVLRVLRVSRLLRLAGHYKGLQSLFNTILLSVQALFNVFMLLMLFFFILATLGQFMFSGVKTGRVINEYKNFTVFDKSFLLLFSISTGEDWNLIMYDCSHTAPDCIEGETCGSVFAPAYFIAFILLVTYVMLNLFILVIIQQFQKLYLDDNSALHLFNKDYELITEQWIKFTERHHCIRLNAKFIYIFFRALPHSIGCSFKNEEELKVQVLKMNIKSEEGWIYFNELLYRILRNKYGTFQLNKNMQIRELITQFKLFNVTMGQIKNKNKKHEQENFFRKVGSNASDTVNPFLTKIFQKVSLIAWRNHTQKVIQQQKADQKRQIRRDRNKALGVEIFSSSSEAGLEDDYEEVEIEEEFYFEQTVSSDEDDEYVVAPQTNKVVVAVTTAPEYDNSKLTRIAAAAVNAQIARKLELVTPKEHRSITKERMRSRESKFATIQPKCMMISKDQMRDTMYNLYLHAETNSLVRKNMTDPSRRPMLKTFQYSHGRVTFGEEDSSEDKNTSEKGDAGSPGSVDHPPPRRVLAASQSQFARVESQNKLGYNTWRDELKEKQ